MSSKYEVEKQTSDWDEVGFYVDEEAFLACHAKSCPSNGERLFSIEDALAMSFWEQMEACGVMLSEDEKARLFS